MSDLEKHLAELISQHGLAPHSETIVAAARPAIDIVPAWDHPTTPGGSHFGGAPDLPPEMEWPHRFELPYSFVAQIRLTDLPRLSPSLLPENGLLSVFVAVDPDGEVFWQDDGYVKVYRFTEEQALAEAEVPKTAIRTPDCALSFLDTVDLPYDAYQFTQLQLGSDEEWGAYSEVREKLHRSPHYLLGYPSHCTLAYNPSPGPEWVSLPTLWSEEEFEWCWHDGDKLMVFIREEDLKTHRFDSLKADAG